MLKHLETVGSSPQPKGHVAALSAAEQRVQQKAPLLSVLQREVAGLQIALRILRLVSVSEHGLGLNEVHAYKLLGEELPSAGAMEYRGALR